MDRVGIRYIDRITGDAVNELAKYVRPEVIGIIGTAAARNVQDPLRRRLVEKHNKSSPEGEALRALLEIRVRAAPSWSAQEVELMFWFIGDDASRPTNESNASGSPIGPKQTHCTTKLSLDPYQTHPCPPALP